MITLITLLSWTASGFTAGFLWLQNSPYHLPTYYYVDNMTLFFCIGLLLTFPLVLRVFRFIIIQFELELSKIIYWFLIRCLKRLRRLIINILERFIYGQINKIDKKWLRPAKFKVRLE